FLLLRTGGIREQRFPLALHGALGGCPEWYQAEFAIGQGQQLTKRFFSDQLSGRGVNNGTIFNVNLAGGLRVADFKDRGVAAQAFQLDDIEQTSLAQGADKIVVVGPPQEAAQHVEYE